MWVTASTVGRSLWTDLQQLTDAAEALRSTAFPLPPSHGSQGAYRVS
jgi:hypothetical protein